MNYNYKQALNYPRVFEGNYIDIVLIVKINDGQYCIQGEDILIYSYFIHDFVIVRNEIHNSHKLNDIYETIYLHEYGVRYFISILDSKEISYIIVDPDENILEIRDYNNEKNQYSFYFLESKNRKTQSSLLTKSNDNINVGRNNYLHYRASNQFNPNSNIITPRAIRNGRKNKKI